MIALTDTAQYITILPMECTVPTRQLYNYDDNIQFIVRS